MNTRKRSVRSVPSPPSLGQCRCHRTHLLVAATRALCWTVGPQHFSRRRCCWPSLVLVRLPIAPSDCPCRELSVPEPRIHQPRGRFLRSINHWAPVISPVNYSFLSALKRFFGSEANQHSSTGLGAGEPCPISLMLERFWVSDTAALSKRAAATKVSKSSFLQNIIKI